MKIPMKTPIFIIEPGSLYVYKSQDDAELDLEPIDVQNCLYSGYDATGRLLKINVINNKTKISIDESEIYNPNTLELILRDHLNDIGIDVGTIRNGKLDELIEEAQVFQVNFCASGWEMIKIFFMDIFKEIFSKIKWKNQDKK